MKEFQENLENLMDRMWLWSYTGTESKNVVQTSEGKLINLQLERCKTIGLVFIHKSLIN